jgi:sialidase-1
LIEEFPSSPGAFAMKALVLPLVACLLTPAFACADEPLQAPVFVAGKDGYHTYRIPSLLVTKKGTLLAFCEGRLKSASDTGAIHLLLRRSLDGGKTWLPTQIVRSDAGNTCGNPCPVLDRDSGDILLLTTHNLGTDTQSQIVNGTSKGGRSVWLSRSDDDGRSWSKHTDITKQVKKDDWTWYATGPGVGIQTTNGRLIIPCNHQVAGTKAQESHALYSDDKGATWKLGGVVGPLCDESQVVERDDGSLMLNIRSYRKNNRRVFSISKDGGESWSPAVEDAALIEPVCQASLARLPGDGGGLLFANPASKKRENLTLRLSRDEGKTWPTARVLHAGPAAYSCLAALPDGDIGLLYERGDKSAYETITFARIPRTWLFTNEKRPGEPGR